MEPSYERFTVIAVTAEYQQYTMTHKFVARIIDRLTHNDMYAVAHVTKTLFESLEYEDLVAHIAGKMFTDLKEAYGVFKDA